jgi:GNAT superfamily N-acetyltransferase
MGINMSDEYKIVERSPTVKEYQKLRKATGWKKIEPESIKIGLYNTLYSICVIFKDNIVGCGRVIGDGSIYFYIQDIIVLPEFQRKGIGKLIMNSIIDYLKTHAHQKSFIGLMAAEGVSKFYEKFGFTERAPDMPGMFMYFEK